MEQLQRVLELIRAQLGKLGATQKLLVGSLVVVMLMALFLVTQYAGGREMVELMPAATPEQQQKAISFLRANSIEFRPLDGKVLVPADKQYYVLAQLSEGGAMPSDAAILFGNLAEKTTWSMSPEQARAQHVIALQNELARVIAEFRGIRTASVFVDAPAPKGLGQAVRMPTATATVFTDDGRPITQDTVDAVAHLVASSKAGLSVASVRVIDGSTNRQHSARSEDDMIASTYFEHAQRVESRVRDKLLELLSYVDGVVVAVNAHVDVRKTVVESERFLQPGQGTVTTPLRESTTERKEVGSSGPAEAGVRPNTSLDIARGGSTRSTFSDSQTESELASKVGSERRHVVDPRGMPTRINATINVPRAYFAQIWRQRQGGGGEGEGDAEAQQPADTDLAPIVEEERARIAGDIAPIVESSDAGALMPGVVVVSMIPDTGGERGAGGGGGGAGGGGGGGMMGGTISVLAGGLLKTVALGAMALMALGMMAMALKKATKPAKLPTAQELVGIPPAIAADTELVGEADEADAALAGVEMSDDELQLRKKVEQVTDMIKEKPADAARLVGRWIKSED